MLVRRGDKDACLKARRLKFKLVHEPAQFVQRCNQQQKKAAQKTGHVVSAVPATDFGIAAQLAGAFVGAYFTSPTNFAKQDLPRGIQYKEKLWSSTTSYHLAVTAGLQEERPTLPHIMRTLAQSPSSCVHYYLNQEKLFKFFRKNAKGAKQFVKWACVLCLPGEELEADKKYKQLYRTPADFLVDFEATVQGLCPGARAPRL